MKQDEFKKFQEWLGLFKDCDGSYKSEGKGKKNIMYDTKHSVRFSNDHRVTELIILEGHRRVFHDGLAETLTKVRSQKWLIKGRQVVKKVLKGYELCRKVTRSSYPQPTKATFPEFTINERRPFKYSGIDF